MTNEPVKILCVDDDPYVVKVLQRSLSKGQFQVLTAGSAEKGVEIFKLCSPVQIVIADFNLPSMNNVGFLRMVNQSSPEAVSILISSCAEPEVAASIDDHLIFRRLSKPWERTELQQVITEALVHISVGPADKFSGGNS